MKESSSLVHLEYIHIIHFHLVIQYLLLPEMLQTPYYIHYSPPRMMVHKMVTSKYFDLAISAVIGLNVITMAMEFYMMPRVSCSRNSDKKLFSFVSIRAWLMR